MIVYDLICEKEHQFESWFKNSSAYDFLRKSRKISCPVCSSTKIKKAPMAPNISRSLKEDMAKSNYAEGKNKIKELSATVEMTEAMKKTTEALNELQAKIEKNFENVGKKFPEEARNGRESQKRVADIVSIFKDIQKIYRELKVESKVTERFLAA